VDGLAKAESDSNEAWTTKASSPEAMLAEGVIEVEAVRCAQMDSPPYKT
jgi:hypothetical protein